MKRQRANARALPVLAAAAAAAAHLPLPTRPRLTGDVLPIFSLLPLHRLMLALSPHHSDTGMWGMGAAAPGPGAWTVATLIASPATWRVMSMQAFTVHSNAQRALACDSCSPLFPGGRSSYNRSAGYDYPDPRQGGSRYEGRDCDNGAARYGHSRSGYGDGGGYHGTRTDGNERGRAFGGRERSGDRSGGSSSSHSVIYSDRFSWEEGRQ
jgi:hypothetical protein